MENNHSSRRAFLKTAAVVGAPAVLPAQAPGNTLRVAVVGVGNRGSFLLRHLLRVPGAKVVAVCDIVPERAEEAKKTAAAAGQTANTYTDFRRMLDQDKGIDAVVLATPDWTHKDFDISILEVGKHLYAEKPLSLSAADGRMVVSAAKRAKGIAQIGFQLRYDPARNASEQFIHSGGIGRVLMCHGIRHGGDLPRNIPWYFDRTKSGDIVIDQGLHILDLFTWAIGKRPLRAYGTGSTSLFKNEPPGRTVMDNYSLVIEYPDNVQVNFSHHYFDPPGFTGIQERVFGSLGAIDLPKATWQPRDSRKPIKLEVPNEGEDSTYMSLAAFVENARNQRQPKWNHVDDAYVSLIVPLMATKAIHEKRIVTWDEVASA